MKGGNISKTCFVVVVSQILLMMVMIFHAGRNGNYLKSKDGNEGEKELKQRRTDVVILFTKMKSGSTLVGSIFNKRKDITYLYEPLYPYGEFPCNYSLQKRLETLHSISSCQFEKVAMLYQNSHRIDKTSK